MDVCVAVSVSVLESYAPNNYSIDSQVDMYLDNDTISIILWWHTKRNVWI